MSKMRVYWREAPKDFHPDESCWAVQHGTVSIGFVSWDRAFKYAYLNAAIEAQQ